MKNVADILEKLEKQYSHANQGYIIGMTTMKEVLSLLNCDNPSPGALRQARIALEAGILSAKTVREKF